MHFLYSTMYLIFLITVTLPIEIAPKNEKKATFPLIIDIISDIIVFTDVQPVHIC